MTTTSRHLLRADDAAQRTRLAGSGPALRAHLLERCPGAVVGELVDLRELTGGRARFTPAPVTVLERGIL